MPILHAIRRHQKRFRFDPHSGASVAFTFPHHRGEALQMGLRDVSWSGLSFRIDKDLQGLDVGDILSNLQLRVGRQAVRGELLVMHLTPGAEAGSVCGGLFYPASDDDLLTYRDILQDLEQRFPD